MVYTPLTNKALVYAYNAHHGQLDKSGIPYVFHPFHLAEQMQDEVTTIVALLHDVVEDTHYTIEQLTEDFGEEVALLVDGVIGGAVAVIGFLPLVMVMYFLIALLEDCGYMARASVVLDPIFKRVGLSGKSIIPFVIGTGCAIPGVMACRTIRDERERRATAMLAPFMP